MNDTKSITCDLGLILTILFVVFKLTGVIAWSWGWVLSPLWIPLVLVIVVPVLLGVLAGIASAFAFAVIWAVALFRK